MSLAPSPALPQPSNLNPKKRPFSPKLLPPFDPRSSPPKLPSNKRFAAETTEPSLPPAFNHPQHLRRDPLTRSYPTPIPTSSLGTDVTSSPPRPRRRLERTNSTLSARNPLGSLTTLTPPRDGSYLTLGRSSMSSDYQLASNRLISRIHVKIRYHSDVFNPRLEIECEGWNGIVVHCAGSRWEMKKGDVFLSSEEGVEVLVDVLESRVRIGWPKSGSGASNGGGVRKGLSSVTSSPAPPRRAMPWDASSEKASPVPVVNGTAGLSPTDSNSKGSGASLPGSDGVDGIKIFEDKHENVLFPTSPVSDFDEQPTQTPSVPIAHGPEDEEDEPELPEPKSEEDVGDVTITAPGVKDVSDSSDLDSLSSSLFEQENRSLPSHKAMGVSNNFDSALHSFAVAPTSPTRIPAFPTPRRPHSKPASTATSAAPKRRVKIEDSDYEDSSDSGLSEELKLQILNNLTNRLAFSRASSLALTPLFTALPPSLSPEGFTKEQLQRLLEGCPWIGKIKREGKDARGKKLEDMFFYEVDGDVDQGRRKVWLGEVDDGSAEKPKEVEKEGLGEGWGLGLEKGGRGLRGCRKVHKQYYWKKPRKMGHGHH